jgi:hypothetical protein
MTKYTQCKKCFRPSHTREGCVLCGNYNYECTEEDLVKEDPVKKPHHYTQCNKCLEDSHDIDGCVLCGNYNDEYTEEDLVKKPHHYTPEEGKVECIDYIRQVLGPEQFIGYCHGNFIKYQHRYKYKGAPVQDLEKAKVYLDWMVEAMKGIK